MATGAESDDDPPPEQERPAHMERRRWPREPAMRKERPPHASPALVRCDSRRRTCHHIPMIHRREEAARDR